MRLLGGERELQGIWTKIKGGAEVLFTCSGSDFFSYRLYRGFWSKINNRSN